MARHLSPDPELEALVQEINTRAEERTTASTGETEAAATGEPAGVDARRWSLAEPTADGFRFLERLLRKARDTHASDLLLVSGTVPTLRRNGKLHPSGEDPLDPEQTEALCAALVPERRRDEVARRGSSDFSLRNSDTGVLRCNVHRERGLWAASVRLLPEHPPDFDRLNLPPGLARLAALEHGLILVTGPTGSGKSTTLAALVRRILETRRTHLITIEDPVEFEHAHRDSVVEHIEIGRDVESFPAALRSVLRQDPDVLLIGEMRDVESMSIAITAAETGHLVLATLHTGDSAQTIHRILDSYPGIQQDGVRAQLSVSLAAIVSQQLIPRLDGDGRVPALEILIATPAVRNQIRQGRMEQLRSQLLLEQSAGMLDLDRSLVDLVNEGLISLEDAQFRARSSEAFQNYLKSSPQRKGPAAPGH